MAGPAADSACIHDAGDKIIALHPILVRRSIREVGERGLTGLLLFQFPIGAQSGTREIAHRPVVVNAIKRSLQWLALRVALDANIRGAHKIEPSGIHDVVLRRLPHVVTAWAVAFLAAYIP